MAYATQPEAPQQASPAPRRRPAAAGWAWLRSSLSLFRAQPARLLLIAVLLQLILGLSRVPGLGLLVILAVPALTAGLLQALHLVETGRRPSPATLFAAFSNRARIGRLLVLGMVLFAVGLLTLSTIISGALNQIDPGLLARLEQGEMPAVAELDPLVIRRFVIAFAVAISVSGTLSFLSIPLMWFGGDKLGASLARGVRALMINWKPYGVLALGLALLGLPVAVLFAVLFELAASGGNLSVLVLGLMMVIMLGFQLVVFGTQYSSFRDIFPGVFRNLPADGDPLGGERGRQNEEGQLVA